MPSDHASDHAFDHAAILSATRHWLTRAVIGLNLCPFAKAVHVKGQIRHVVSEAADAEALLRDLESELRGLAGTDPTVTDTTLLIVPRMLHDFDEYNDFLYLADQVLRALRLEGVLQIASFHPDYRFAGTEADAIENYTNRSPYPILHLLREDSIARAVEAFPDAEQIYGRNEATLRRLGHDGWRRWMESSGDEPS